MTATAPSTDQSLAEDTRGPQSSPHLLYHVQVTFRPGVKLVRFQEALNPAHSWYRMSGTAWLICSPEGARVWAERLTPFTQPNGELFISRFDTAEYYGQMPKEFWEWLKAHLPSFEVTP